MKSFKQFTISEQKITPSDLKVLEKYADRLFAKVGIDVNFTRHFLDRVNDSRNNKQITSSELTRLFKQSYQKYGKKIASLGKDAQAVINDMKNDINMPFVLKWDGKELDLIAKTIMRKKNFQTSNPKLQFEKAPDTSDAMKRYKSGKAGFTDIAHLKAKGLIKRSDGTKRKSDKYK